MCRSKIDCPLPPPCLSTTFIWPHPYRTCVRFRYTLSQVLRIAHRPTQVPVFFATTATVVPHTVLTVVGIRPRIARDASAEAPRNRSFIPSPPILKVRGVGTRTEPNVDGAPTVADASTARSASRKRTVIAVGTTQGYDFWEKVVLRDHPQQDPSCRRSSRATGVSLSSRRTALRHIAKGSALTRHVPGCLVPQPHTEETR